MKVQERVKTDLLKMTIPTGRIQPKVLNLLQQIGFNFGSTDRSYRPTCAAEYVEAKLLKSQNIPELVALGRHDCGFAGYDWIVEQSADVVELADLGYNPVRIIAAVPEEMSQILVAGAEPPSRQLVVASEYRKITTDWIAKKGLNAVFVRAFGATEALPPEDADIIVDNTATGATLKANRLVIIDELLTSTTRFICNKAAYENPEKRKRLDEITMLIKSTLRASERVLLEMNVSEIAFQRVVSVLPCMRAPTVSKLHNEDGFAIKVAVPTKDVATLIPQLVALGATDILEYRVDKIVSTQPD